MLNHLQSERDSFKMIEFLEELTEYFVKLANFDYAI
jgi:hypothetical protein